MKYANILNNIWYYCSKINYVLYFFDDLLEADLLRKLCFLGVIVGLFLGLVFGCSRVLSISFSSEFPWFKSSKSLSSESL